MGARGFCVLAMLLSAAMGTIASATPAMNVKISYDQDNKTLRVQAVHPSYRLEKNFIRRLEIYRNGTKEQTLLFSRQKSPAGLAEDIGFAAEPGDRIRVELYCNQGGASSAEHEVEPAEKEADE